MRPRRKAGAPLTAAELVEAVERSGLKIGDELRDFLADLGYNPLTYLRARYALRHPEHVQRGYRWDLPSQPPPPRYTNPRRTP